MAGTGITRRDTILMAGASACAALLPAGGGAQSAAAPAKPARPALTLFSQHLNWVTDIEEAVEVAAAAGYGGIAWTVRQGALIDPRRVATELPRAVELTHRAGLGTPHIVTALIDAGSPYAEPILETANGLGIHPYRVQGAYYDYKKGDLPVQLAAMRPRIEGLVRLNERYGATALFHTHGGHVGGAVWDTWLMLRDFDPARVAINFDTGLGMLHTGSGWMEAVQFARRHIAFLSLKDFRWQQRPRSDSAQDSAEANGPQWVAEVVPPGEGMVDFRAMLGYFQATGFHGPTEVQIEYTVRVPGQAQPIGLMANAVGQWQLQMSKADYIALLKRDVDFYAARFRETGLAPAYG